MPLGQIAATSGGPGASPRPSQSSGRVRQGRAEAAMPGGRASRYRSAAGSRIRIRRSPGGRPSRPPDETPIRPPWPPLPAGALPPDAVGHRRAATAGRGTRQARQRMPEYRPQGGRTMAPSGARPVARQRERHRQHPFCPLQGGSCPLRSGRQRSTPGQRPRDGRTARHPAQNPPTEHRMAPETRVPCGRVRRLSPRPVVAGNEAATGSREAVAGLPVRGFRGASDDSHVPRRPRHGRDWQPTRDQ